MSVSRRGFLVAVPAAGTVLALAALGRGPQSPGGLDGDAEALNARHAPDAPDMAHAPNAPVVSFHLDRPYLDLTGREEPYLPPAGLRSGAPLSGLSEEEVFSRWYGFI